ncbi:MAG: HD domain-containing phosphohydrolase [Clostridia bacterium]
MDFIGLFRNFIIYFLPVAATVFGFFGIRLLKNQAEDKVSRAAPLLFAASFYTLGYFLELNSLTYEAMIAAKNFEYLGVVLVPPFLLFFIADLTNTRLPKNLGASLLVFSLVLWALFITNNLHNLFYTKVELVFVWGYSMSVTQKNFLYFVLLAYFGISLIVALFLLIRSLLASTKKKKKQSLLFLIFAFQLPWVNVALILAGLDKYFDYTPFTLMIMGFLFIINNIVFDMFEFQTHNWKNTFLNLDAPAFLMSTAGEIVANNDAATQLMRGNEKQLYEIIGKFDVNNFGNYSYFIIGGETKWFDVKKSIFDQRRKLYTFVFFDITDSRNASIIAGSFLNSIKDFVIIVSDDTKIIFVNDAVKKRFGYPGDSLLKMNLYDIYEKSQHKEVRSIFLQCQESLEGLCMLPFKTKSGALIPSETRIWRGEWNGRPVLYSISKDITSRKILETALEKEKRLWEITLKSVGDGVISTDEEGQVVFLNRVAETLTGWLAAEAVGKNIAEVYSPADELSSETNRNLVYRAIREKKIIETAGNLVLLSKQGIERPIEETAAPIIRDTGEVLGAVLIFRDISDKRHRQREIEFLSYHDQLTGIYNRRFFNDALRSLDTAENLPLSLIMVDVNGLKLTNDAFGHKLGDLLLERVAEILSKACGAKDIAARIGGDEFILLLPNKSAKQTESIIHSIKQAMDESQFNNIILSVSIGYGVKTLTEENINEIYKKAEDEMYRNKLSESSSMRSRTIDLIMNTLHEKNRREMYHSLRVGDLAGKIARAWGLDDDEVSQIKIAGSMHDIGKIGISERILEKKDPLEPEERAEIERHSEIGYRILSSVNEFSEIAAFVLSHHERWDGKGYPRGLKGNAIPLKARIIAVADVYDAVTNERPYGKVMTKEEAVQEIQNNAGGQFDPDVVKVFVEKVVWEYNK